MESDRKYRLFFFSSSLALSLAVFNLVAPPSMTFPIQEAIASTEFGEVSATRVGEEVQIVWTDPSENASISISADGVTLVQDNAAGESIVEVPESGAFSVTWSRDANQEEILTALSNSTQDELLLSNPEALERFATVELSIGETADQPDAANAATLPASTTFRYSTFIRDAYVYAPDVACIAPSGSVYEYNGNNRGFSSTATTYKTRFGITIDWANAGNVTSTKAVQPTKLYRYEADGTRTLISTATASTLGMGITVISESATLSTFRLIHDVRNPFCNSLAGGIYYDVKVSAARSGNFSASGVVLKFPDHEFYVKDSDQTTWTTIFQNRATSLACLSSAFYRTSACHDSISAPGSR